MDSIFHLGEAERAAFLRHMMHSFGSTYICLWSYSPLPSKLLISVHSCLLFLDGFYHDHEKAQQPSSSSGSTLAARLFTAYCGSGNYIDNGRVPGFAFRNKVPYLEMQADYLHTMISTQLQLQFYQEAGIKTAVFMGCAMGEIELGFSTEPLQVNLQMEIQSWFPSDFSRQIPPPTNETSSSSLSVESIKYFDIPKPCFNADLSTESLLLQDSVSMSTLIPEQQFPTMETRHHGTAFTSYRAALAPVAATFHKPNLFKRAILFFKNLQIQGNQPTPNQLHHVIAERRRREKLNESFKILKTLLPQVTKKDKASVLSRTTEYLSSLRSQLGELTRRNVALQTQILTAEREGGGDQELGVASSTHHHQRVTINVEIAPSTSEARFMDLRMSLRSEKCSLTDFVARVLGFLKRMGNVSLLSVQSNTRFVEESAAAHTLILRLKAEGDEFDESGFQEAVRRVVDDLPH